ncbi:peptide-methionine (S)-S-oxide reductase [Dokdonia sinensis]|uniref:Peptide methionine sulfoxide reductase MsrA n=1 Tax=Dokdonia sinensis TaxID=2479847 RepID=A0A3M0G3H8_9FLAO|nr:peptide-methionine (S)-S-oxide reductase MsrA [Dokdonia sinensis]RMB59541.1 peptide-methionine (S)-S-oxide reductase [Dokdonia sinensis]
MKKENINLEKVVFAAGCFWCTEAVFQRVAGVISANSGYTGGTIKNPAYREICTGRTGHAEGILVTYDPSIISFKMLLEIFFATHDPTTLNRQGNDKGTQYRSGIFYTTEQQKQESQLLIAQLDKAAVFENDIVTEVTELGPFYYADEDHQDYYNSHRSQPYCQIIIDPKVQKLKQFFKDQLKSTSLSQ